MLILPADGSHNLPFEPISRRQPSRFTQVTTPLYSAHRLFKTPSVVFLVNPHNPRNDI